MTPDLLAKVLLTTCGECWQDSGESCGDGWDHACRYLRAHRRGLITSAELQEAVHKVITVAGKDAVLHD